MKSLNVASQATFLVDKDFYLTLGEEFETVELLLEIANLREASPYKEPEGSESLVRDEIESHAIGLSWHGFLFLATKP